MMEKKMILIWGVLLIALMSGCDNELSIESSELLGEWDHLRTEELNKKNGNPRTDLAICIIENSMVFNLDGTGCHIAPSTEDVSYSWHVNGGKLVVSYGTWQQVYYITRCSSTELYLEYETREGVWYRNAYRKK